MPQAAQARAWWADVEDVRERIERKRARELEGAVQPSASRRGVREVRPGRHLMVVRAPTPPVSTASIAHMAGVAGRRRPRRRAVQRVGPRPDRIAAWAVVLGFALVLAAVLSAHG